MSVVPNLTRTLYRPAVNRYGLTMAEETGQILAQRALEARNGGQRFFTPYFATTFYRLNVTGTETYWAYYIAAIEDVGWKLIHWSVVKDPRGHPEAWPVFERSD